MNIFTFYIDQKVTNWDRKEYQIEADDYDQAVEEAKKIYNGETEPEPDDLWSVGDIRDMEPEQNHGCATKRLFSEDSAAPILENV